MIEICRTAVNTNEKKNRKRRKELYINLYLLYANRVNYINLTIFYNYFTLNLFINLKVKISKVI